MNQSLNLAAPPSAAPVTLAQLVFSSAERFAGRTAIEDNGECLDFAQLPERVMAFTRSLMALGIQAGDRIGIWAPNSGDWILAALGIQCAGAVLVPINTRMKGLEAADVLERNPGALIIYDVKCTGKLQGWVLRHGGTPMMWKTGHSLIKAKMRETEAELAGEMSGHFFFRERWYGFDDGLYAGARMLEILTKQADPSALLNALPQSDSTPELHLHLAEGENFIVMDHLRANAEFPDNKQIITIDGLRVEYEDGFGLARSSNTTPVIVMRFEAETPAALARIQGQFRSVILAAKPDAELPF